MTDAAYWYRAGTDRDTFLKDWILELPRRERRRRICHHTMSLCHGSRHFAIIVIILRERDMSRVYKLGRRSEMSSGSAASAEPENKSSNEQEKDNSSDNSSDDGSNRDGGVGGQADAGSFYR